MALSDIKFAIFLVLVGLSFWLPLWAFFNLLAIYIDRNLNTAQLYSTIKSIFGTSVANFLSQVGDNGDRRILGETIAHTGYIIMIFQVFVSRIAEKFKALPTFLSGLFIAALGLTIIGYAHISSSTWVFLGILLFAIGEMTSSPRIQEYITWIAPKEKAGLYMGSNFLAMGLGGALSGIIYTSLYGYFRDLNHPEYVWFVMAAHFLVGVIIMFLFTKISGAFKELEA